MHSVNSKHGRHILQLIMTFIAQHYTTTVASGIYKVAELPMQSHSTQTLHQVISASSDEDAQPVSLMYTCSHHMHEPSTNRPLTPDLFGRSIEGLHAMHPCVPSTLTTDSDPIKQVPNLSPVFRTCAICSQCQHM